MKGRPHASHEYFMSFGMFDQRVPFKVQCGQLI
jgi:hypothetical protein